MSDTIIDNPRLKSSSVRIEGEVTAGKSLVAKLINNEVKPYFNMVGNGKKNNLLGKGIMAMDLILEMTKLTDQEQFLIREMRLNLIHKEGISDSGQAFNYPTNVAKITGKNYTDSEKQRIKTGFKRLKEKDIVKRVKREHYIFNPQFIIPFNYSEAEELWNSISSGSN